MRATAILLLSAGLLAACSDKGARAPTAAGVVAAPEQDPAVADRRKITKTDTEWRKQLTELQYRVTREQGTERAFTGKYWDSKKTGVYGCVCCEQALFASATKYKSGTGWPSFWRPIDPRNVSEVVDKSGGWVRTEIVCSRCDAHLGHLFDDGPDPTGLRYCMNSAALDLQPKTPAKAADQD